MLTVLNDIHAGVLRSAGTTPTTQWKLREKILADFDEMVRSVPEDLMILGDLFDTNAVPLMDLLGVYNTLSEFLDRGNTLYLVAGNHDLSKTSSVLSSFGLLCSLLSDRSNGAKVITEPTSIFYGHVIPHLSSQEKFDLALSMVPEKAVCLFLHCNYDNNFAAESDQSLNLSAEQAAKFQCQIVIAHEHQMRRTRNVCLPGNQIVSSVSDCLGTEAKYYTTVDHTGSVELYPCYPVEDIFVRMDWRALTASDKPFIRVEGDASAEQAADVVAAISRYRSSSDALVITNAVRIASDSIQEAFAANLESVKAFDVMAALKEILSAEEFAIVEGVQSAR